MSADDTPQPPRSISLPRGWVAEVVTYLEMLAPAPMRPETASDGLALTAVRPDAQVYRDHFRRVGEPWLWASRLRLSDAALLAIIRDPAVEVYELRRGNAIIGLLELDFRRPPDCELAFFGVIPEEVGSGAGRWLMNRAIARAWSAPHRITRVFVHTCTNDHPAALAFYLRSGFVPYARGVEMYPDPRHEGVLPPSAAGQIPLL